MPNLSRLRRALVESGKIEAVEHQAHGAEVNEYLRIEWERHAKQAGYKRDMPKERTDASIREQRMIGWVMMTGSVLCLGCGCCGTTGLRVRAEGEVVIGTSGQRVELDSIVKIDRKQWAKKGIAFAIYEVEWQADAALHWMITNFLAVRPSFLRLSAALNNEASRKPNRAIARHSFSGI